MHPLPLATDEHPLVWPDTETPHLLAREPGGITRLPWEIALIIRTPGRPDTEHVWQVRPDLSTADPEALRVGGYAERCAVPAGFEAASTHPGQPVIGMDRGDLASHLHMLTTGAVLVGSNPRFDSDWLTELLYAHDIVPAWHHHTYDIVQLAAGYLLGHAALIEWHHHDPGPRAEILRELGWPWRSYQASEGVGVPRPGAGAAHTALGDARWHRDVWDAVTSPVPHLGAPRPALLGGAL